MSATTVITRVGNRVIEWDCVTLELLLTELRSERQRHDIAVETENAEAEHERLMSHAEQIKQHTTNKISEARAT